MLKIVVGIIVAVVACVGPMMASSAFAQSEQFLKGADVGDGAFTGSLSDDGDTKWLETTNDANINFHFTEKTREKNLIYLFDAGRSMWVTLPVAGGMCKWSEDGGQTWNDLCNLTLVEKAPTAETYHKEGGGAWKMTSRDGKSEWVLAGHDASGAEVRYAESRRDRDYIYLFDASSNITVALPVAGGVSQWSKDGGTTWEAYFKVERASEAAASSAVTMDPDRIAAIRRIVTAAGRPADPPPAKDPLVTREPDTTDDGGTHYINEKHNETENTTDITHLGLNDAVIYPGALIRGNRVNDFVYPPITLPRAPIKLSVSAEGSQATGEALSQTVADPQKLSSSRQATADLLKGAIGPDTTLAARVDFEVSEVHSEEHMLLTLGADVKYGVGKVKSNFSWDEKKNLNHVVAKYKQIYFTVDVDTPATPADLFLPTTPVSVIEDAMSPGSMPLYVGTVTYGMMATIFMESDKSASEMKTSLEAGYKGLAEVDLTSGYTSKDVLEKSKLKIQVYGGSTAGLANIESGFAGFKKVIEASKTFSPESPGVPISYVFRNLQDNLITAVTQTAQYNLRTPIKEKQKVKITIQGMSCLISDDEGNGNDADMDRWDFHVDPRTAKIDGTFVDAPKKSLYNWSTPGEISVKAGSLWTDAIGKSITVTFDTKTETYDFNKAELFIEGYGREYDSSGSNEEGTGSITLTGQEMFGSHNFTVDSADFQYKIEVLITRVD